MMLVTGGIMLLDALLTASGADFTWMATGRLLFGLGAETNNIATLVAARHFAGANVAFAMTGYQPMMAFFGAGVPVRAAALTARARSGGHQPA
jgi:hypothetical protein